jgi:hypothetical protein
MRSVSRPGNIVGILSVKGGMNRCIALTSVAIVLFAGCERDADPAVGRDGPSQTSPTTARQDETGFRLLTHCGLSYPMRFQGTFWLPVDQDLRKTINPPLGFASDGYYDEGTVRVVDDDTVVYTSSGGIQVEYAPTKKRPFGCE